MFWAAQLSERPGQCSAWPLSSLSNEFVECELLGRRSQGREQIPDRPNYPFVPLTHERGKDVLAYPIAPYVVAAVTAWVGCRVQIDPVLTVAADYPVAPVAGALCMEPKRALQARYIDAASGIEIDHRDARRFILLYHANLFDINGLVTSLIPA
jgi:hypothetical protein